MMMSIDRNLSSALVHAQLKRERFSHLFRCKKHPRHRNNYFTVEQLQIDKQYYLTFSTRLVCNSNSIPEK